MRIDHDGIEELLSCARQLRENNGAWHHVFHSWIFRSYELLGDQVHAVDERRHQAAVRPRIQGCQLVEWHRSVNVYNRLMRHGGEVAVDIADAPVDLFLNVLVLFNVLARGHCDEHKDRPCVVQDRQGLRSLGVESPTEHSGHSSADSPKVGGGQASVGLPSVEALLQVLQPVSGSFCRFFRRCFWGLFFFLLFLREPFLCLGRLLQVTLDGCKLLRQSLGVVQPLD
mmetsp:Transcript_79543/g.143566  ORF Transcript_79543/g.143566 Transcript_79543/m.143566 type:complete len:227 (+) Transcript_79543:1240-1920(+)